MNTLDYKRATLSVAVTQEEQHMSFIREALKRSQGIWDECAGTPFVQAIKAGTLPIEKFKAYMIQDSIYLKHYARVYGMAMYRSTTLKEIQMYYSALSFVTETESAVRRSYLKQFGITDDDIEFIPAFPENQRYIDFMTAAAENGELPEILMAILPCMLSYCYIFKKIAAEPSARSSRYWDFISDYANMRFDDICLSWQIYTDSLCDSMPAEKKGKLNEIFAKGNLLELDFWKMAYRAQGELI